MRFAKRVEKIAPSATLGITAKAKSMKEKGEDVIVLAAGEPAFDTPAVIKEAAIKAIKDGFTKYAPTSGTPALKEAICRKLKKDNNLDYVPAEIVVSCGAKHSLYNVFQVLCDAGDEVLIIDPYWLSYPEMVKLAGATPKFIETKAGNGFRATADDLKKALTKKTRALILNSPSNPAGVVYDEPQIREIVTLCLANGTMIVSDEIYEKIIFDGKKHFSPASISPEAKANTVTVNGLSKSYSMTGWRIGYIAAPKEIAEKVATMQDHSTSNACSISLKAAECALDSDLEAFMKENCEEFKRKRDILFDGLSKIKGLKPFKPSGAFYMFLDISATGLSSMAFATRLLEESKVAVIPGGPFGADAYVRVSFATEKETISKGVERIKSFVEKLK